MKYLILIILLISTYYSQCQNILYSEGEVYKIEKSGRSLLLSKVKSENNEDVFIKVNYVPLDYKKGDIDFILEIKYLNELLSVLFDSLNIKASIINIGSPFKYKYFYRKYVDIFSIDSLLSKSNTIFQDYNYISKVLENRNYYSDMDSLLSVYGYKITNIRIEKLLPLNYKKKFYKDYPKAFRNKLNQIQMPLIVELTIKNG